MKTPNPQDSKSENVSTVKIEKDIDKNTVNSDMLSVSTTSTWTRKRKRAYCEDLVENPHSGFVELNVGGRVFHTTRETLCKGETLFKTLFSQLNTGDVDTQRDMEGRIFVDRNPDVFRITLDYLRTGVIRLPSPSFRFELQEQLLFFGIEPPECFTKGPHMITICWNSNMPKGKMMEIDPEEATQLFTDDILKDVTLPEAVRAFCTIGFELKQSEVGGIETVFILDRVVYR